MWLTGPWGFDSIFLNRSNILLIVNLTEQDKLLCIGQLLDLGAEDLPLVKLVVSSGSVDVYQHLVVQRNREYWIEKIEENIARDKRVDDQLRAMDWTPIHFWSKEALKDTDSCISDVIGLIIENEHCDRSFGRNTIAEDISDGTEVF